ncbi:MAG: hypothetical protein WCJ07_11070 [Verrucomicrobiota bacterium]
MGEPGKTSYDSAGDPLKNGVGALKEPAPPERCDDGGMKELALSVMLSSAGFEKMIFCWASTSETATPAINMTASHSFELVGQKII